MGAVALARRLGAGRSRTLTPSLTPVLALGIATLPAALNWRAVERRREPEASLARTTAEAMLWSAPPRAVLVAAGDNDAFPMWYLQTVEGARNDVQVVVAPLLNAPWYVRELDRRAGFRLVAAHSARAGGWLDAVAAEARRLGRPLAVTALAMDAEPAAPPLLGAHPVLRGAVLVEGAADGIVWSDALGVYVDTAFSAGYLRRFGGRARPESLRLSIDPAPEHLARLLLCAQVARDDLATPSRAPSDSLASPCNFR